jgi:hypothetical protein
MVIWWDYTGYAPSGYLESTILDTECSPQWASIEWSCNEPAGADLYIQYKTSDDPESMGEWSEPIYEPCVLSGLVERYFQYRVNMESSIPTASPVLEYVMLNIDPTGVCDDPVTNENRLIGGAPNPSCTPVCVCFSLESGSEVQLRVFDCYGRLIEEVSGEFPQGPSEVVVSGLQPGIYFVRMVSGDFSAAARFVVIE